jgi:hypothetical protein
VRKIKTRCVAGDFRAYLDAEIDVMLAEVVPACPVESPDFNEVAISWIEKNAALFRKKWERCHHGKTSSVIDLRKTYAA